MKNKIIIIIFFSFLSSYSQISKENQILEEAKKRNINTTQEAINELNKNGISITQAQEMASMQGIDLNTFLVNNFLSKSSQINEIDNIVDTLEVVIDDNLLKAPLKQTPKKQDYQSDNYFGYSIFQNNPFASKNYLVGNIDEGYLLSPGDELRITVYGNNALTTETKIDLNGNIVFPQLGVFQAAGNSLKTLKSRLKIFLGKFYNGLVTTPQNTFIDISLTQIRPVSVNILGEAVTPGPHLVNGLASVLNALYSAGGIKTSGSLRKVLIYRDNKLIKELDLYDYITKGNLDSDIRLMSSDVIFIPPRLNSVLLEGAVKNIAIFELKKDETLENLIDFSGGILPQASLANINLSRIVPFENRSSEKKFDKYLLTIDFQNSRSLKLIDGDVVSIPSILSKRTDEVRIEGSVNSPGIYSLNTYQDLKTLIENAANGVLANTFMDKVDVVREDILGNKSFNTYNLTSVMDGIVEVKLEQDDLVKVYSSEFVEGEKLITISGFGTDEKTIFWRENLSIFDIIFESTSFEELEFRSQVLASRIDLESFSVETGSYSTKIYSLNNIELLKTTFLNPKDRIRIYSKAVSENINPSISVIGSVNNPLQMPLKSNMVVEDAILIADGFEDFADKDNVTIIRKLTYSKDGALTKSFDYKIDKDYLLGKTLYPAVPFYLEDNDIVTVRTPNRDDITSTVRIIGEINYPGTYPFSNFKTTLSDLIVQSRGLTKFANINSTQLIRDGNLTAYKSAAKLKKQLLSPNDLIIIGSILEDVKVNGNGINNPTAVSWLDGKRSRYYINRAAGKKKRIESVNIIRKNGSSKKVKNLFSNPKIYPGDVIFVNQKPPKEKSSNFQDEFIRLFSLLTGTLTTILLIEKL